MTLAPFLEFTRKLSQRCPHAQDSSGGLQSLPLSKGGRPSVASGGRQPSRQPYDGSDAPTSKDRNGLCRVGWLRRPTRARCPPRFLLPRPRCRCLSPEMEAKERTV
jgi:hypothetical protein